MIFYYLFFLWYSFRLKTENGENAWLYFCSLKYFYLNLRNTKNINHNDGFPMLPATILTTCCLLQPLDYVLFCITIIDSGLGSVR